MISDKILEKINCQINNELFSAYFYMGMSSYSNLVGLKGFANWFDVQIQEELSHARIFYNYIVDQSKKVKLFPIEVPESDFKSPLDLFKKTLAHEKKVSFLINEFIYIAREEQDYATDNLLAWFIREQVEEEANVNDIISKLELIQDDGRGLLMLDLELNKRVFVQPSLLQKNKVI